ncbi:MAG TPA: PVC-type heme-binding CxxCH protein [Tepidisphaeraceae bacterium]|nr:PVC-type heme-binding CxxCH protein [Tepidisphaeraceae bacterium]
MACHGFVSRFVILCFALIAPTGLAAQGTPTTAPAPTSNVADARGLDQALERLHAPMRKTPALSPKEEQEKFQPRAGLSVDLIASEPAVRQPLCINFDERGRMWVVQYIQYPFPAGLKVVEYDQYIRAKFDKVPPAPPHQDRGHDQVTILEDVDGDGSFRKVKTFVDGLNIATSALPGRGGRGPDDYGVWVMNPPYLLFYPDKNRDDVPDGDPIVHLSGFGLEDTHAVASNLTWGPDGWLYGTQGSTCTAKVKVEITGDPKTTDFLGQAIWRYNPESHQFEVFAEGGGNTFGLEFDDAGRAYSGTNWGKYRGLHYVQGGYYIKSWGKHGPLTNPYAFGFFEHMPHTGNADRLSHTYIVYGGGLLGDDYTGKIISPNPLQSRLQVTRLEPIGSTYQTVEEPYMVTCDDGWFRPVDLKAGPDGAIYVADFYEQRISHVDPRDTWDRTTGRIWRVRPTTWKPGLKPFDFYTLPSAELVKRLQSNNRWERNIARQILTMRADDTVAPNLRRLLVQDFGQHALEALLALRGVDSLDDQTMLLALKHRSPEVRTWAVRLTGDAKNDRVSSPLFEQLLDMAYREMDPQVRSQLASTAKRLPAEQSIPLAAQMLARDSDAKDAHIPLLLWWAVEDKAVSHREKTIAALASKELWKHPLAREVVLPRLARRYAAEPTPENQDALAELLKTAPDAPERVILIGGIKEGFGGSSPDPLQPSLVAALKGTDDPEIGLRLGDPSAAGKAIDFIRNEKNDREERIRTIALLGQLASPESATALVDLAAHSKTNSVRVAAISALGRFNDPGIGSQLVELYPKLPARGEMRTATISTLLARPHWTAALLAATDSGAIARSDLGVTQIQRVREYDDPEVVKLADKLFGKKANATSREKADRIARVTRIVTSGAGEPAAGKELFTARCAVCHTLFGEGGKVGPDLTGYERRNVDFLALSIVDPSAYVREEFTAFRIRTKGGETLIGLITARDPNQITLQDAARQKTTIPKSQIIEERALPTSLMPEGLLDGLGDQQLRDLFKYLSSDKPPAKR